MVRHRFHRRSLAVAAFVGAAFLGALSACSSTPAVTSVGPKHAELVPPGAIARPFVQAGTVFAVRLDQPLDTYYTPPGTRFTATVIEPLSTTDGHVVVPVGAKVTGELVSDRASSLRRQLRVHLLSIDTVDGRARLEAKVTTAQHVDWNGPSRLAPRVSTYDFYGYGGDTSVGNAQMQGQSPFGYQVETPREVRLPKGAEMQLELVRPIVIP